MSSRWMRLAVLALALAATFIPLKTAGIRRTELQLLDHRARGRADGDFGDMGGSDDALSSASFRAKENASRQRIKGIRTRTRKNFSRWRDLPDEEDMVTMCWNGPAEEWGGVPLGSPQVNGSFREASASHNIVVTGEGCLWCVVGARCHFLLNFASNVYFDFQTTIPEINVLLTGPSLAVPQLESVGEPGVQYIVSYVLWDEGLYTLTLASDCALVENSVTTLLRFDLYVFDRPPRPTDPHPPHPPAYLGPPTPCAAGVQARWVPEMDDLGEENAVFRAYPCSPGLFPVMTFGGVMGRGGVREISFIGDEHMRNLVFHLQALMTGRISGEMKGDWTWEYRDPSSGKKLKFNFYWLDGMYENGVSGCQDRGVYSGRETTFPSYSPSSDLVVVNEGYWTMMMCKDREQSYSQNLPRLLEWLVAQRHKPTTKFIWRSTPPFPMRSWGLCNAIRNRAIDWANKFARDIVELFEFEYMDFWDIELVHYDDTCYFQNDATGLGGWEKDNFYSCVYDNFTRVYGPVGEAVARTFMGRMVDLLANNKLS